MIDNKPISQQELAALHDLLEVMLFPSHQDCTAEYMDEENPEAGVCIKDKDGQMVMFMPTEVYWEFRDGYVDDVRDTD